MAVEIAPRIVVDEKVAFGKPVIQGTRVPVEAALRYAARVLAEAEVRAVPLG